MQSVAIFEAKAKLSELVKPVHVVEVTVHKKPVARIYPVFEESEAFMAELKRQCTISENITEDDGLEALQNWSD